MKVGDLIDLLMSYQNDDEIEIEIYETTSEIGRASCRERV